jgi:AcrR family transcriptional regulator
MDTRNRIIEQASTMFFKYGIRSITMDEIAESLGISKRTLYESFSNKEELLRECLEAKHKESTVFRDVLNKEFPNDPLEIMHQHFRQVVITLNSLHPNFFNDLKKYHSTLWKRQIESKQDENMAFTRQMIEKGIKTGVFRESADAEILSRMMHSMMQIMSADDLFPETRYPRAEVARQIMLCFIRGMATVKGLEIIDDKFN